MSAQTVLNPLQQRVADDLLGIGHERPAADLSWAPELRAWLDESLQEHIPLVERRQLWITKRAIAGALGCEARHLATQDDFEWSREIAKGVVVHHAVALVAAGSMADPLDLANAGLDEARDKGGQSLRSWLNDLTEQQRLALVSVAVAEIGAFLSGFPPMEAGWNPVAEFPIRATIGGGKVRVSGRVDLALGSPRPGPDHAVRRERLLLEIKSGRPQPEHRVEHVTYALLELLRSGIAPFRAATYYTTSSTWVADDITLDLLFLAGKRLIDATKRLIELSAGREPERRPGWRCGYCPLVKFCLESGVEGDTAEDSHDDG
jgi:CRISPR/Cas system-associated exonuclease Cas4 (RecB family)